MKFILLTLCFVLYFNLNVNADYAAWNAHKQKHADRMHKGINYDGPDKKHAKYRYDIFCENVEVIRKHNEESDKGYHTYKKNINQFAHYSYDEFKNKYLMSNMKILDVRSKYRTRLTSIKNNYKMLVMNLNKTEQVSKLNFRSRRPSGNRLFIDWTKLDCVDKVIDQGACGSCYAYTTVGAVESAVCIEISRVLIPFSKQQMIDCSFTDTPDFHGKTYKNKGCIGGNLAETFKYIKHNGLMPEYIYPYREYNPAISAETGFAGRCQYDRRLALNYLSSYATVTNFRDMIKALRKGPLAAYIYVSENLYAYDSGVFSSDELCNNIGKSVNHAVLIVGIGIDNGVYYWKVKNTWGTAWGENGYFRIALGRNLCNIEMQNFYPILR